MVGCDGPERRRGVQGARRPDPAVAARPPVRGGRSHADRARVEARHDALRRDEALAHPRARAPRPHAPFGPEEAALPEPGPDPADSRPLDRQVHRAARIGAHGAQERAGGSRMTDKNETIPNQIYEIYIKAAPQAIWDAITKPEWTERYGYRGPAEYELRPGGAYRADASQTMVAMGIQGTLVDGEVIEADPPRKLVQTYRFLFSDAHREEGYSRVTWEIAPTASGFTRLTVTHELAGKPIMASMVASKFSETGTGGW